MTTRYPILRHRELRPRLRWSAWRERRAPLAAGAGEVLVHEIDGEHRTGAVDTARATAVTLVDVRPDVQLFAEWHLAPSDSAARFPVRVTYHCTVVDPVAVLRNRRTGAWYPSWVLAQDTRPFRLHGEHPEGDENGLQRALTALLSPSPAHRALPGIRVELGQVTVGPAWPNDTDEA
ncbi:hypothetical protein [Streptomyces sp. AC550_RSS872]|uniref:hypothetical protein n=1 Tax=Streptomyces sp. AC550_RSS872 TaxID=2823689 RepID=UPI001C26EC25|nr:hypothetical protein [Streptomyces sp. AC550_RSS872]